MELLGKAPVGGADLLVRRAAGDAEQPVGIVHAANLATRGPLHNAPSGGAAFAICAAARSD